MSSTNGVPQYVYINTGVNEDITSLYLMLK